MLPTRAQLRVIAPRAFLLGALLLASSPAVARAQDPREPAAIAASLGLEDPLPPDTVVTVGTLPNGLRYYVRPNDEPENRAELRLVVNAGSILEEEDQRGLAHFLEHMAFNGSEHFEKQELVEYMESIGMRLGAGVNASTGFEETTYRLTVPTDSAGALETAFQILEDWAHGLTLDPAEIDLERGVVVEEWRLGRGAGARLRDQHYPVLFRGSRYAERLPIGSVEVLESFDPEALRRFYRDWYRPDLMAVVAVGDFDAARVEGLVERHFSGVDAPSDPKPRPTYPVPDHEGTRFAIATDPEATGTSVSVYFKLPPGEEGTVGAYRQSIVEGFFTSMLNQRLRELAQQAEPPFLGASSGRGRLTRSKDAFTLGAGVEDGGVPAGLQTLLTEAERVTRHGFTDSELERVKTNALRSMERAYEARGTASSSSFVGRYTSNFLNGTHMADIGLRLELYRRFLPTIGVDEVNGLARRWITDGNRVVLVGAPEKEGVAAPTEDELVAVFDGIADLEIGPYEETLAEEPLLAELPEAGEVMSERRVDTVGVTEWELSNGVLVALKPTDFRDDQILFTAISPGGTSLVDDEDLPAVSSAVALINASGLGAFGPIDLGKKLTGVVASANATIGDLEEGMRGSASPRDLETMFRLIHLRFTAPRADSMVFLSGMARARAGLENRSASPAAAFGDTVQVTMTQGHPRAPLPSVELLERTDLTRSLEFYRDRFADAGDFTFVFVGDFDLETMRPLVERYLASLPATGRVETWRDVGPTPPEGVVVKTVYAGVEPQSRSLFVFTGDFEDSRRNRATFRAMTDVLESQLRDRIREELGGSYSVGVSGSTDFRPTGHYSISITFGSDPERVNELRTVVFEGIRSLQRDGPRAEDLDAVKEALRRTRETNLESNAYWAGQLAHGYRRDGDFSGFWDYEEVVAGLTGEAIRDAAARYFDMGNYVQVTLMPESARR